MMIMKLSQLGGGAERDNVMSLCSKWYITNKIKIVMILSGYFYTEVSNVRPYNNEWDVTESL